MKIFEMLSGLKNIMIDEEKELIFIWNGNHTVQIYTAYCEEIDVISLDYGKDKPDCIDFKNAVESYKNGDDENEADRKMGQ